MKHKDQLYNIAVIQPIDQVFCIAQGSSAVCYKVVSNDICYFVKLFNDNDFTAEQLIASCNIQIQANKNGLSAQVIDYDSKQKYLVCDYIEAPSLSYSNLLIGQRLRVLATAMVKCHQLCVSSFIPKLNILELVKDLIFRASLSEDKANYFLKSAEGILADLDVQVVSEKFSTNQLIQSKLVVVHGDLNEGNILYDGKKLTIIDWDCCCLAEPEFDIAMCISINMLEVNYHKELIRIYLEQSTSNLSIDYRKVTRYLGLCHLINGLWYFPRINKLSKDYALLINKHFVEPLFS